MSSFSYLGYIDTRLFVGPSLLPIPLVLRYKVPPLCHSSIKSNFQLFGLLSTLLQVAWQSDQEVHITKKLNDILRTSGHIEVDEHDDIDELQFKEEDYDRYDNYQIEEEEEDNSD